MLTAIAIIGTLGLLLWIINLDASNEQIMSKAITFMQPGETVEGHLFGAYQKGDWTRSGVMLATQNRLIFYGHKMTGYDLEILPYSAISSVEAGKDAMGHRVTFFVTGNRVDLKWINKQDVPAFIDKVRSLMGKEAPKAAATPQAGGKFCVDCGNPITPDARFCGGCGKSLAA